MAVFRRTQQIGLEHFNKGLGSSIGTAGRSILGASNPLLGLIAEGGHFLSKALPKDRFGIDKSEASAALASILDPSQSFDFAANQFQEGNIGKGILGLVPGVGGVLNREEMLADLERKQNAPDDVSFEVGAFDPNAGRISGAGIGVDKTITSTDLTAINNRGVNVADVAGLASAGINFGTSDQAKSIFKGNETIPDDNAGLGNLLKTDNTEVDEFDRLVEEDIASGLFNNTDLPSINSSSNLKSGTTSIYSPNNRPLLFNDISGQIGKNQNRIDYTTLLQKMGQGRTRSLFGNQQF